MKYVILGIVALLTLTACDKYNKFVTKYDPDATLRCMFLDTIKVKATEQGVTVEDWVKTEKIAVCAVPAE